MEKYTDEVIIETFKPYPLSYPLNEENCEKFINACDEEVKEIVRKIIKNIQHISFEEFLMNFNKSIRELNDLLKDNKDIIIVLYEFSMENEKSTEWLKKYFINYMKYLKNKNKIYVCDNNNFKDLSIINTDKYYFVLIDDCAYSGSQINIKIVKIFYYINLYNLNDESNIILLIPYISNIALDLFLNTLKNLKIFFWTILSHILIKKNTNDILSVDEKDILNKYDKLNIITYEKYDEKYDKKYLVYFDHKLPDIISTIPSNFYYGIVLNQLNLKRKKYGSKLEQYPLISNCEFVEEIENDNDDNTICPPAPYKKNYEKKIIKIKKYKKSFKYSSI